jgi:hypothetical protein
VYDLDASELVNFKIKFAKVEGIDNIFYHFVRLTISNPIFVLVDKVESTPI